MAAYDAFAPFYDAVQGDRAEHAAYLRSLIQRHHPDARTVLELACGTGSILAQLQDGYELTGVDSSQAMLDVASAKVPEARLVPGDMRSVQLDERFDVVLCVFDSLNHLLEFEEWEATFDRAREHLEPGRDLRLRRQHRAQARPLRRVPPGVGPALRRREPAADRRQGRRPRVSTTGSIEVFEHVRGDEYRHYHETIREACFPAERVLAAVRARFGRVRAYDDERARPTARTDRLHVVCHARRRAA